MKDQLLGNNLLQQSCYDTNTLRLTKLRVYPGASVACGSTPTTSRLNLSFTYQNNGNISQIVDATRSETLNYTYDELDRLDIVSGPYSLDYNYNTIGNITSKSGTSYTYGSAAHKHAVTVVGARFYSPYINRFLSVDTIVPGYANPQTLRIDEDWRFRARHHTGRTGIRIKITSPNIFKERGCPELRTASFNSNTTYPIGRTSTSLAPIATRCRYCPVCSS